MGKEVGRDGKKILMHPVNNKKVMIFFIQVLMFYK